MIIIAPCLFHVKERCKEFQASKRHSTNVEFPTFVLSSEDEDIGCLFANLFCHSIHST